MKQQKLPLTAGDIWYYYKAYFLIGAVILGIVGYLIFSPHHSKKTALNVTFIGASVAQNQESQFQNEATKDVLTGESGKYEISPQFILAQGGLTDAQNADLEMKLTASVAAKTMDVLVLDKKDFLLLQKDGYFLDLSKKSGIVKAGEGHFVGMQTQHGDGKAIYGIDLTGNSLLKRMDYVSDDPVLGIVANTPHLNTAVQFAQWLLQQGK